MGENKYFPTSIALYFNYFMVGMVNIIIAQNMLPLMKQLSTDTAGIAFVISGLGIGKIIILYVAGAFGDKFGRKPFIYTGIVGYIIFFIGILFCKNLTIAFLFAVIAGMANSFLDSATYPALMESYPKSAGTANILIKAFVSIAQLLLPLMVGFLIINNLYYGYSFLFGAAFLVIIGIFLVKLPFPTPTVIGKNDATKDSQIETNFASQPKFSIEGISLIIIGFTCTTTFYLISVWLPTYGQQVAKMARTASLALISYYSLGSLISVFITAYLVKKLVKPVVFVFVYPLISFISLTVLWLVPTPSVCIANALIIGFTAAGGVLQLALTCMAELFPVGKGKITGMVYTSSSLAFFIIPIATGILSKTSISNIILLNLVITAVGVLLGLFVNIRYHKVISVSVKELKA